jgi:hypothetical protein
MQGFIVLDLADLTPGSKGGSSIKVEIIGNLLFQSAPIWVT